MSRSLLLPLLALGGVILYGTTQASKPVPEPVPTVELGSGRVDLGPDGSVGPAGAMRRADPPPPPAPRLRSDEETETAEPTPTPEDSSAADPAAPAGGGVPLLVNPLAPRPGGDSVAVATAEG